MTPRYILSGFASVILLVTIDACKNSAEPDHPRIESGSVIAGTVQDNATSRPVAFARVSLNTTGRIKIALTDAGGRFVFRNVIPSAYHVIVDRAEYDRLDVGVPQGIRDTSVMSLALQRKVPVTKPQSHGIVRLRLKGLEEDYNGDGIYRPLQVKGAAFSPTPIGAYSYNQQAIDRSMLYLDSLHATVIRTYSGADPYLLTAAAAHGIYVIVSYWVNAGYDLSDPSAREEIIRNFSTMVTSLKNYPSVLLWNLGNEQNLPYMNGDNPFWYDLVEELAVTAYGLEGDYYHPVAASNGDFLNIGDPAKRADDSSLAYMDLWGSNIYKLNLTSSFASYRTRTGKPVVLTEFGIDALDNRTRLEYEDVQARQDSLNWIQILAAADVCVGATVFEFTDEWWKAGDPAQHDFGGYASGEHPDGFSNEEWWGLIAVTRDVNGDGYDEWRPRRAFRMFQRAWQ